MRQYLITSGGNLINHQGKINKNMNNYFRILFSIQKYSFDVMILNHLRLTFETETKIQKANGCQGF